MAALFLLTGCAHGPAAVPSAGKAEVSLQQNSEALSASTDNPLTGAGNTAETLDPAEADSVGEIFGEPNPGYVADPIGPWNWAMFHFNDKFYFHVLKPAAKGYRVVVPRPAREGIQNFFTNLITPIRFVSCLLQGKGEAAESELSRFFMNTTTGVLGFGNPAKKYLELSFPPEDLGQTLGSYGIANGFYIVWPFLGPSTLRDTVGWIGDSFLNPVCYVTPLEASLGIRALDSVNEISFRIGDYESFKDAAISPYEAFRDAYIQHRKKMIKE